MDLASRDFANPYICKIFFDTVGGAFPVGGDEVLQNFFDSMPPAGQDFSPVYYSKGKVSFSEKGERTRAGVLYSQKLEFGFPLGGRQRSVRIAELLKTKSIAMQLTTGLFLVLGRNDVFQNTSPKAAVKTDQKTAVVTFQTKTSFPSGFAPFEASSVFPYLIPTSP